MAVDQEEVESTLTISGAELAAAIWPSLLADQNFLKALATNPAFITALTTAPPFVKANAQQTVAVAGPSITAGLGR